MEATLRSLEQVFRFGGFSAKIERCAEAHEAPQRRRARTLPFCNGGSRDLHDLTRHRYRLDREASAVEFVGNGVVGSKGLCQPPLSEKFISLAKSRAHGIGPSNVPAFTSVRPREGRPRATPDATRC